MKSLSLALLIFGCFAVISARNILVSKSKVDRWLDMSYENLLDQCISKSNNESFDGKLLLNFYGQLPAFMDEIQDKYIEESDFLMNHIYNPDMIKNLKDVIDIIQNCLDEKDRLDPAGIVEVMDRVLRAYAIKVALVEYPPKQDFTCFKPKKEEQLDDSETIDSCFKNISKSGDMDFKIYNLLMLEFISQSTCEKMLPSVQCALKFAKSCTPKIRKIIKMVMSPAEIGICENFPEETHENLIEDIGEIFDRKENPFPFKKLLHL